MFTNTNFAVAIIGEKAAGKDTVADLVCKASGAWTMRYSDPIRVAHCMEIWGTALRTPEQLAALTATLFKECEWLQESMGTFDAAFYKERQMLPPSTFVLQDIGNSLKRRFNPGVLTRVVLQVADMLGKDIVVMNGMRNPSELDPLEELLPVRHVLVGGCADLEMRKKRFLEGRRRVGDPVTEKDFLRLDARDKGEGEPSDGQQVTRCLAMVSPENMIYNNGTLDELKIWVKNWYTALAARHGLPMQE